jgi:hypothetical protein
LNTDDTDEEKTGVGTISAPSVAAKGNDTLAEALVADKAGNVYVGGIFDTAGGVSAAGVAKWDGTNRSALGAGLFSVEALALDSHGTLYACGNGGLEVFEWDGSTWAGVGNGLSDAGEALVFDHHDNLYVGGPFAMAGGITVNYIAKLAAGAWEPMGSGLGSYVRNLAVDSYDNLFVAGQFGVAGTNSAPGFAEALVSPSSTIVSLTQTNPSISIVTARGTPNFSYALDFAASLTPPVQWTAESTNNQPSGNLVYTNSVAGPQGFYRTRFVP